MEILQEYTRNRNLLSTKIEEILELVSIIKEYSVKLQQYERAAKIGEMEKQLEQMKIDISNFAI